LIQKAGVVAESAYEEFKREALWSYRANVPTVGDGNQRQAIPFENWFAQLSGVPAKTTDPEIPEISDAELEAMIGTHELRPPGM